MAEKIRVLDLFSGIGGISLGLERTGGFETVAFCEIEPFCRAVLRRYWPHLEVYENVKTLRGADLLALHGRIDCIAGGFPCQQISAAGKGEGVGTEGAPTDRSGLWWEMRRLIREIRPAWVFAENVPTLRTRGADSVIASLEQEGYTVWASVVGAWAVGAPHKRDRIWLIGRRGVRHANPNSERGGREGGDALHRDKRTRKTGRESLSPISLWGDDSSISHSQSASEDGLAYSFGSGLERLGAFAGSSQITEPRYDGSVSCWPARPGQQQYEWEEPRLATLEYLSRSVESEMGGAAYGLSDELLQYICSVTGWDDARSRQWWEKNKVRVVSRWRREVLRALGNSVVPQVVEVMGRGILEMERYGREAGLFE